jgi:benzoyl-CoA 2,3-dioxygenase component B
MSEDTSEAIRGEAFVEVNYDDRIPNNVSLSSDKQLQRALETWQPNYVDWWKEMGPEGFRRRRSTCAPPWGWTRAAGPSSAT